MDAAVNAQMCQANYWSRYSMLTRITKVFLVAGVGLYLLLVVFNNITDYASNYTFLQHVMAMDTTLPRNAGMWRAIHGPWIYHAFYVSIIAWEATCCGLTLRGAWSLWRHRGGGASEFNRAKGIAVGGLALNMLQWLVAFLAVGGEWFLMWQSRTWNANDTAGRMFIVVGIVLLFVNAADEELSMQRRPTTTA
jgi:predicted small integral membrane protein